MKKSINYKKQGVKWILLFAVLAIAMLAGFSMLVICGDELGTLAQKAESGIATLISKEDNETIPYQEPAKEWLSTDDVLEGDAPPDNYTEEDSSENEERSELFPAESLQEVRSRLIGLAEDYNEMIPYGHLGRSWSYGYFKQEDGYENILYDSCSNGLGIDSLGYVIWIYRNSLGHTPSELQGEFTVSNLRHPIRADEAQIGDMCMTAARDQDVCYGVVCGFSAEGHMIITMCDNIPNTRFKYGCNHLAYVKNDYNEYLGDYTAVDFTNFYRLDEFVTE